MTPENIDFGSIEVKPEETYVGEIFDIELTYTVGINSLQPENEIFLEWGGSWLQTPNLMDRNRRGCIEIKSSQKSNLDVSLTDLYYSEKLGGSTRAIKIKIKANALGKGEKIQYRP